MSKRVKPKSDTMTNALWYSLLGAIAHHKARRYAEKAAESILQKAAVNPLAFAFWSKQIPMDRVNESLRIARADPEGTKQRISKIDEAFRELSTKEGAEEAVMRWMDG